MIWAFIAGFVVVLIGVFVLRPRVRRLFHNDFQGIKTEAIVGPIIALTIFLTWVEWPWFRSAFQRMIS